MIFFFSIPNEVSRYVNKFAEGMNEEVCVNEKQVNKRIDEWINYSASE